MTPAAAYTRIALASLTVVVLVGVWLRGVPVAPGSLAGFQYAYVVHAHSHLALFGWGTAGMMALLARGLRGRSRWAPAHALVLALASAAAFVSFLLHGYGLASIAISSVHVLLWVAFVAGAWSAVDAAPPGGEWLRVALVFLLLAGVAAVLPAIASARGASPLVERTVVKLFLTLLVQGWIFIAAVGVLLPRGAGVRASRIALGLLVVGTLPSAMAHVPAVDSALLVAAGRVGMFLTGAGSLLAASVLFRAPRDEGDGAMRSWLLLAAACVLLKGVGEAGASLAGSRLVFLLRPAVIAYLHLVLLGVLTAALVARLAPHRAASRTAMLHAAGLVAMLGALLVQAALELTGTMSTFVTPRRLNVVALGGGVLNAVALLAVTIPALLPARRAPQPHHDRAVVAATGAG